MKTAVEQPHPVPQAPRHRRRNGADRPDDRLAGDAALLPVGLDEGHALHRRRRHRLRRRDERPGPPDRGAAAAPVRGTGRRSHRDHDAAGAPPPVDAVKLILNIFFIVKMTGNFLRKALLKNL